MTTAAGETLPAVRRTVRDLLLKSAAFHALSPEEQRRVANNTVKVARYMVDAGGETAGVPFSAVIATGLADPPPAPPRPDRAEQALKHGKSDFTKPLAGQSTTPAAEGGVKGMEAAIRGVDFPKFVGGLVEGTFNAIVSSSIKQMEAYSALVENIAKSVDDYMRDNVTTNQARDYLADKYPQHLKVDATKGSPQLVPLSASGGRAPAGADRGGARGRGGRGGVAQSLAAEPSPLPDFMKDLGLPQPIARLDPATVEEKLVPAARRRMAMDRQQLLATMVLMGISRLVVDEGTISASCLFKLDTTDSLTQYSDSQTTFDETVKDEATTGWRFWFVPPATAQNTTSTFKVTTYNDSESENTAKLHAELAGNVEIHFRSETMPLERIADMLQLQEIEAKAPTAAVAAPVAQRPPIQLPPPPALPPMPGFPGAPAGGG